MEGFVYLFSRDGTPLWKYQTSNKSLGTQNAQFIAISPHGQYMAKVSGDSVFVFNRKGELLGEYNTTIWPLSVAISDDGTYVIGGAGFVNKDTDNDGDLSIFSRDGKILSTFRNHQIDKYFFNVGISSDGQNIIGGAFTFFPNRDEDTGELYVLTQQGKLLWSNKLHENIDNVAISADGNYMVTGSFGMYANSSSNSSVVYFFSRDSGPLWKIQLEGHLDNIAISQNGRYVIGFVEGPNYYSGDTGYLYSWDGNYSRKYQTENGVRSTAISAEDKTITTVHSFDEVKVLEDLPIVSQESHNITFFNHSIHSTFNDNQSGISFPSKNTKKNTTNTTNLENQQLKRDNQNIQENQLQSSDFRNFIIEYAKSLNNVPEVPESILNWANLEADISSLIIPIPSAESNLLYFNNIANDIERIRSDMSKYNNIGPENKVAIITKDTSQLALDLTSKGVIKDIWDDIVKIKESL